MVCCIAKYTILIPDSNKYLIARFMYKSFDGMVPKLFSSYHKKIWNIVL